jgi:glycosyltransferase involved in cell wall biosynthesis
LNIICLSKDDWDDRCGRKQQLMFAIAKNDPHNRVIYAEPPRIAWYLRHSEFVDKNKLNSFLVPPENLQVCSSYRLPFERYSFLRVIGRRLRFKRLLHTSSAFFGGSLPDVLWIYNPWDGILFQNRNAPWLRVVDWTEDWTQFQPNLSKGSPQKFGVAQKKMISRADIVFVVTERLFDEAKKLNQNIHLVPNATIPEHFDARAWEQMETPLECRNLKPPVLGWVGHIGDYFDFEMTHLLAKAFPEASIMLIGGYSDRAEALSSHENVYLLGHKPYSEVPNYVRCFDVCIAPYIQGISGSPTKLYDYLASGKPIVGRFDSVGDEEKNFYRAANTIEEFITEIKCAIKRPIRHSQPNRDQYTRNQSWQARAEIVCKHLKHEIVNRTS